jgi:hypothetical protein
MSNKNDNRVLGRRNARDLSAEEVNRMLAKENTRGTLHVTSVFLPDE